MGEKDGRKEEEMNCRHSCHTMQRTTSCKWSAWRPWYLPEPSFPCCACVRCWAGEVRSKYLGEWLIKASGKETGAGSPLACGFAKLSPLNQGKVALTGRSYRTEWSLVQGDRERGGSRVDRAACLPMHISCCSTSHYHDYQ